MDETQQQQNTQSKSKGAHPLTIDRAAFLLLRVKKAFKKKRQQRKDRLAAQQQYGSQYSGSGCNPKPAKGKPAPLLRSRTLPAIIVPGISILQSQIDPNRLNTGDAYTPTGFSSARLSLQPRSSPRVSLTCDDSPLDYRRKSSDAPSHSSLSSARNSTSSADPYIYAFDDFERHPDGTVVLRIPAPHIVAARAYRMSSGNVSISSPTSNPSGGNFFLGYPNNSNSISSNSSASNNINQCGGGGGGSTGSGSSSTSNNNSSGGTALYRLARLLNQSTKLQTSNTNSLPKDDAPRRLSWERRDPANSRLPRSSSIDSMVEAVWSETGSTTGGSLSTTNTPRPSLTVTDDSSISIYDTASSNFLACQQQLHANYGNLLGPNIRRESLLSPSAGRRTKQHRGLNEISLPDLVTKTNNAHSSPPCNNENGETQPDDLERKHIKSPTSPNRIDKLSPLFRKTFFSSSQRSHSTNGDNYSSTGATYNMDFLIPQPPTSMVAASNHRHSSKGNNNNSNNNGYHHKNSHNHNLNNNNNNNNPINIINHKQNGGCKNSNSNLNSDSNNYRNSSVITIQMAHVKNLNYHQTNEYNNYNNNKNYNNNSDNILSIDNNSFNLNNKMSKKQLKMAQAQLNKLTQINIHLHALFSAVEHGHLEKARTILESTDVDVNSSNTDGLAPLDVAVLSNNRSMTKMLLQHGAIQGNQFKGSDTLGNHLTGLLRDAENKIQELGSSEDCPQTPFSTRASFSSIIGNTGQSVTGCTGSEIDKQLGLWERRVKGLRRMLLGWDQARPPDPPNLVTVDVTGMNNVTMRIHEPNDGPIGTKFKVQWSSRADFSNIVGEREIAEWTSQHGAMGATYRISDLTQGRRYFFRANCGNVKGWGKFRTSLPASVTPSSWRDVENREQRFLGRLRILDDLFTAVRLARPDDASDIPLETPAIQRRNPKKKTTIKQLFSAASKFQKNLRRGIYFACILYHEDKILVTNEDFIPVIEIDETYPSYLNTDYHWLMKVACTWDDVKSLRTDMERNATSAVHFRTKLLSAASQMQSTLSITDLGQLYHKPLRDSHGTIVLSCVNSVKSPKSVSVLNSRWMPLNKIQKKISALHEDNTINEILMYSIADQINYHQASTVKLPKGLYLGYLKMQSSVDLIQVVVPTKTPNVLPHCKIRDNPHISSEEWEFLKKKPPTPLDFRPYSSGPTEVQHLFLESLTSAAHRLFKYMDIPIDEAFNHRLYDIEVIELNSDVSILIICPPAESSCAVPGQREILLQRGDLLSLPIQAFEMIHLRTYQNSIIQKYSRLSCILELDTVLANHSHREAFSSTELQLAKERLAKLQELSANLNAVWKGVRWLMDVIGFARDRQCIPGIDMKKILEFNSSNYVECSSSEATDGGDGISSSRQQLLQPPPRDTKLVKASPGRGSWPGPAVTMSTGNGILVAEHSKSDQHLSLTSNLNSRYLSATSGMENSSSRKNSGDSNYSNSGHSYYSAGDNCDHILPRLPPSRSEDTLNSAKKLNVHHQASHRKRSTTMNSSLSAASSPLLNVRPASYVTATESVHSLSSDSESSSYPITTISSNSNRPKSSYIAESKSMSNVKLEMLRKPQENPLHIDENELSDCQVVLSNLQLTDRATTSSAAPQTTSSSASTSAAAATADNSTIIQVYAAYNTGLPPGTSLKLRVFTTTTAREVVDLVVKQLNMAIVLKGKDGPIYTQEKLDNFCLVAVIGARERCLRDDFRPLQLQNPWIKGRLYVRQKHDLLAAIEHSNRETHLI